MNKSDLRHLIGTSFQAMGLSPLFRKAYFGLARSYLLNLKASDIKAVWLRRSVVNEDFLPVSSDIDMTILIDDSDLEALFISRTVRDLHVIKDVQFLSARFFEAWRETGGFRTRQFSGWKQIKGPAISLDLIAPSKQELAFELGYEVHLLFKQVHEKLRLKAAAENTANNYALLKLLKEMERIRLYWGSQDPRLLTAPRRELPECQVSPEYFHALDLFWKELLGCLRPPMSGFSWEPAITSHTELGIELNIEISGRRLFMVHDPLRLLEAQKKLPNHYVSTKSYVELIKGVGVQEQTLLNEVAAQGLSYYRRFCCQRLAHDLIGAILLEPDNMTQLYYCFSNIHSFHSQMSGKTSEQLEQIKSSWQLTGRLPYSGSELAQVCRAQLDLLASLL